VLAGAGEAVERAVHSLVNPRDRDTLKLSSGAALRSPNLNPKMSLEWRIAQDPAHDPCALAHHQTKVLLAGDEGEAGLA